MTNLRSCVRAERWRRQLKESDFAKEMGISTKAYIRFEEGKSVDPETILSVIRWLLAVEEVPTQGTQRRIELREPELPRELPGSGPLT